MNTIDGKAIARTILHDLEGKLGGKKVCFVVFQDEPVIAQFVKRKVSVATALGVQTEVLMPGTLDTDAATAYIREISAEYDGIVVQLPLPSDLDTQTVLDAVPVQKDIDVLSTVAKTAYRDGTNSHIPPVAAAVWASLPEKDMTDKNIVIVGRGRLVGEPVALMLDRMHVSYESIDLSTDEQTKAALLTSADIIISGAGSPHLIKPDMIKEGVVLIDAGTSEQNGKLVGDIDPACYLKASAYTPVPGGIGPIAVACLFQNLLEK